MRDFKKEMELHSETLGFDLSKVEQGSPDWHRSRAGVVSASKAHYLLMGRKTAGRQTYLNELVASIATGLLPEEIKAKPLQWGKDNEDDAREAYSAATFESVEDVAFIYRDESMRGGCSPDGLIVGEEKGLELKSPWSSAVFIAFAAAGTIKKEEVVQCQFSMWVTGYHSWAFAKFDPRNVNCKKLHHVVVERDEEMMGKIESRYNDFIEDMDDMLKNLGLEFGMQW
jgi:predicted phage-related endonuclease